ncbi:MAG: hypothetical protein AB7P60_20840, partial [Hyphomicrobiaceae bacterium]
MARDLTSDVLTALGASTVRPVLFVEVDAQSGFLRFAANAPPPMTFTVEGESFTGTGGVGTVSPIGEATDLAAEGWAIEFAGLPPPAAGEPDAISLAMGEIVQGRFCQCWLGFLDSDYALIADPVKLARDRGDVIEIALGPESWTVRLTVESRMAEWRRPATRRYTHEDQRLYFPNDLGLEYVSQATEAEI